jgi:microcystin-dependent protein
MSEPFLAEIRIFAGTFAPRGWAGCDGQIMQIAQNTALFSLLGTTYGGDGTRTFALPNLQGSAPMHFGQGPALSEYAMGEAGGTPAVTLSEQQMPVHSHTMFDAEASATSNAPSPPGGAALARASANVYDRAPTPATHVAMSPYGVGSTGGGGPHNNMQPFLVLMFCIALQGVFPQR